MSSRRTQHPGIPPPGPSVAELHRTAERTKESLEVGLGRRGDPNDRWVTVRDLEEAGIVASLGGGSFRAGSFPYGGGGSQVPVDVPGSINGLPNNTPPNYGEDDYTPPPMPTNVRCQAIAPNKIMVIFDPPLYGNHAFSEIYYIQEATGQTYAQFIAASGPGFNPTKPCTGATTGSNPNAFFRGRFDGSNPVLELAAGDNPGATSLGAALNPPRLYFFVRFVSLAKISGPFGPQGVGAVAQPSIDPVRVLDLMTASVTASAVYTNLRAFIGTDPNALQQITQNGRGVTAIFNDTVSHGNTLGQLWTVRQERTLPDGSIVAAGFGLGITEDTTTGTAQSLFAVNADKFAIMGSGTPFIPVVNFAVSGADPTFCVVTVTNSAPLQLGQSITFKSKTGNSPVEDLEGVITALTPTQITAQKSIPGYTPVGQPPVSPNWPNASASNLFVTGATNIPFIVDTLNSAVGIRGKLIVDGLIRATAGDFNSLSANTAFIASLRAGIVNANIIVGQSIIAGDGLPDGATVNDISQVDAWIVQISRVQPGGFPLRIWNPKRYTANPNGGFQIFAFSAGSTLNNIPPSLYLNGDLLLGGNATINLRDGGAVGMGAKSLDGTHYTFWCGADGDYGTTRAQMDANGAFWIRPRLVTEVGGQTFRAGFNLDLFLGQNALALPVMTAPGSPNPGASVNVDTFSKQIRANTLVEQAVSRSTIRIRGLRDGGNATTLVTVSGLLVSSNVGTTNNGDDKMFRLAAYLRDYTGGIPGGVYLIQEIYQDDYSPECYPFSICAPINAQPGDYKVELYLDRYDDRNMSIISGWNVVAFQVATNAALA